MTTAERVKATADYFNLELSEYDEKKLLDIWHQEPIVKEIKVSNPLVIYKPLEEAKSNKFPNREYLTEVLKSIAEIYGCDYLKCFEKNRETNVVRTKVHFCRKIKKDFPEITSVEIANFLNTDHTSVIYSWYGSKAIVSIEPFYHPKRKNKYNEQSQNINGSRQRFYYKNSQR